MSAAQFSPTVPGGRGPLSPMLASEIRKIAKEIGATQVGQEALKDSTEGLIGLQLSEKEFVYFKPQDYQRIKDEQIKNALGLKVSLLEDALKSPNALKKQDLEHLIQDQDISKKLQNNTNTDIQRLIQRIDSLREQLVTTLTQQEKESAKKTEALTKEAAKVEAIKTEKSAVHAPSFQETATRANWFVRAIEAITKFFTIDIPNFFFQRIHGDQHLAKSFLTSKRITEVVHGTLTAHAKIESTLNREKELVDSGDPKFNEELRKECNRKCEHLVERVRIADEFVHGVDNLTVIDDKDLKKEISATLSSLKRLKESTQNCLKNAQTPGDKKKYEERLIKTEGAIFQVSTLLPETNQALRIDKANSTNEMIHVIETLAPQSLSKNELKAQLKGLSQQLTPLDEERALIQATISAIEKDIVLWKVPDGSAEDKKNAREAFEKKFKEYQVILNLLRGQIKEIQNEAHSILNPIKETIKDALRLQNISSRPDVRQPIRQLIAKQETYREIDEIPAKKAEERELSQKMELAEPDEYLKLSKQRDALYNKFDYSKKLAAKLKNIKELETNSRFADNLHRAATILLKEEKKGITNEKMDLIPSNALKRAEARSDALKSFDSIRTAVGMVRREFFDEQESWYKNPHAFVLTSGRLIGEKQPSHISLVERSEIDSGKSLTGILNVEDLSVSQYISFRREGKLRPLVYPYLKDDEQQVLFQRIQDMACFMFVKEKLRDKNLSVNDRIFLEKDFLELEQNLMKPPYMYMEEVLEQNLESINKQIKQYAVNYMIDGIGDPSLPQEVLDARNHILTQMAILERTYRKELEEAIPPAPDETHPLDDRLQSLNQRKIQFEDLFQQNEMKDTRRVEIAVDWINNSTVEDFPSMERALDLYKILETLSSQREIYTSAPERAGARFPLIDQVRQAKAHLQRMMPAIEEERDIAFIEDFIKSNGRDQYYNFKTGKYATERQEGNEWITYRHDPHAINHVIKVLHKYKQYGFHDPRVTDKFLHSEVISKRVPIQDAIRESLRGAIVNQEFVTQYNESIASGKTLWTNDFETHFVASEAKPEGPGWKEVLPWKASAKMLDFLFEPLEDNNPLFNELFHNDYLLSQRFPMERDLTSIQQRVAELEKAPPNSTLEVEDRLNETFVLLALLKKLTNEIDPKQYIEYFIRLKAIKEKTVELQANKESAFNLEIHNFIRSPHTLRIFANIDTAATMFSHAPTGKIRSDPTYLPRSAGKSANYPDPSLMASKGLLENPLGIPVHWKVTIPSTAFESGEVDRVRLLAAYEYADNLLTAYTAPSIFRSTSQPLSEADTAFLIKKRAMIKDRILYPKTIEKPHQEPIKATVINLQKSTEIDAKQIKEPSFKDGISGFATIAKQGGKPVISEGEDLELARIQEQQASDETKKRKWSEGVQQRLSQYEKFLSELQSKNTASLLEYVQKDRISIKQQFIDGEIALRDKAKLGVFDPSKIDLLERAEILSNFNRALKAKPDEFVELLSTFIKDPKSFSEVEESTSKVFSQSDITQVLGEKTKREQELKQLQNDLAEAFEGVKRLEMTDKADIARYSDYKGRLNIFKETFEVYFKPHEVSAEMEHDLRRLLGAIQHALDEKAENYRRKQGLPVDTGRMKVVSFAEMRAAAKLAAAKYDAAEKAKADALQAHPPTATSLMKDITPLLKFPYKNQFRIKQKLVQLSKTLMDKNVQLTSAEIKAFRDAFDTMLEKEEKETTHPIEIQSMRHHYTNVENKLKLYSWKLSNQRVEEQPKEIPQTTTAPKKEAPKATTTEIPQTVTKEPTQTATTATPIPKTTIPPVTTTPQKPKPSSPEVKKFEPPPLTKTEFETKQYSGETLRAPLYRSPFTKPRKEFDFNKDNWTQSEIMSFAQELVHSQTHQNPLWMKPKATETTFKSSPSRPSSSWEQVPLIRAAWRLINLISTEQPNTEAEHKLMEALRSVSGREIDVETKLKELSSLETSNSKSALEKGLQDLLSLAVQVRTTKIDRAQSVSLMSHIVEEANTLYERSKLLK